MLLPSQNLHIGNIIIHQLIDKAWKIFIIVIGLSYTQI